MCYLAEQAIVLLADGAVESVDGVLIDAPARAVSGGTVITALTARLSHRKPPLQPALILLTRNQLTHMIGRSKEQTFYTCSQCNTNECIYYTINIQNMSGLNSALC